MAKDIATFVGEDLWLFIAIVTFVFLALLGVSGLEILAGPVAILGWFLLTPIFLFWGEEIAAWVYGDDEDVVARNDNGAMTSRPTRIEDDPLEELKYRYAAGELTDAEFERRLERLIEVDERYERRDVYSGGRDPSSASHDEPGQQTDDAASSSPDREYERERT